MGDFFRGWRRKFGMAMLVTALGFMAGWMISLTANDSYEFGREPSITLLHSNDGCVSWEQRNGTVTLPENASGLPPSRWVFGRYTRRTAGTRSRIVELVESVQNRTASTTGWKWKMFGFKYGAWTLHDRIGVVMIDIKVFDIPYWSIILPITLCSAYLLLSQPTKPVKSAAEAPVF
jgi:hypothetical protein